MNNKDLHNKIDELLCCIEGKDKEILELKIAARNSIEVSKIEELKELYREKRGRTMSGWVEGVWIKVINDLQKLIDENSQ